MQITPVYAISTFIALPLAISAMKRLSKNRDADLYVMNNIVKFSRFVGILLLISFILASIINI